MPNRIIREGINSSPRINSLSPGAEVLYRRLMSACDDYGRFYASISAIRGACWPTHPNPPCEQDVSNWLAECTQLASNCSTALITRYMVAGIMYIQITDFNQKIRSKSKFPTPADTLPATCPQVVNNSPALDVLRSAYCEVCLTQTEAGATAPIVCEQPPKPQSATGVLNGHTSQRFEEFWEKWPRQFGRDAAFAAWCSYVSTEIECDVFACLERFLLSRDVASGAVPMAGPTRDKPGWLADCSRDGWKGCNWPVRAQPRQAQMSITEQAIAEAKTKRGIK